MEKKKIMLIAISLMLIPGLAQALPFKNINFEKNITSPFVAGSTQQIIVTFDNDANTNQTLAIELNATSSSADYPVWKGDFSIAPILNSGGTLYLLDCEERSNGTFYCFNELKYIVQPNSFNNLTIHVTPKINLYPTVYNFSLMLSAEAGVPVGEFQRKINFTANETASIDAINETNTVLDMVISQNVTGSVNITYYDSLILDTSFGIPSLSKFVEIETSPEIKNNLKWAIIKVYYTDAEVSAAGIDESSLRLYYYNETSSTWTAYDPPNGGVDTTNNYVWANTTHFSLWGIFGNSVSLTPSQQIAQSEGFGFTLPTTTTTTVTTIITPTPTTTTTTPTTATTTTSPSPTPSPITGFVVFVSSPLGLSLLLSLVAATVLIIIFYKKRYAKKKSEEKK